MLGAGTSRSWPATGAGSSPLPAAGRTAATSISSASRRWAATLDQLAWQHRLANHLADRGVPAARALGLVEHGGHWYEVHEPAAGEDVYAGADSWDPFASEAHAAAAGRGPGAPAPRRRRLPRPARRSRRPASSFSSTPVAHGAGSGGRRAGRRPAGGRRLPRGEAVGARRGRGLRAVFDRLRPRRARAAAGAAPRRLADQQPLLRRRRRERRSSTSTRPTTRRGRSTWRSRSSATASSGTGSRPATTVRSTCGHVAALVGAYDAVAPLTPAERAAFADVLQACQFEYGISFLDYYWGVEHDREKADWAWETFVARPRPLVGVRRGPRCACRRRADRRRRLRAGAGAGAPSRATPRPPRRGRSPTRSRRRPRGGSRRPRSRTCGS